MTQAQNRFHVAVSNPNSDSDCFSVSRLFRRAADAIDDLGEVEVHDLVLQKTQTARGGLPGLLVYYSRPKTSKNRCGRGSRRKATAPPFNDEEKMNAEHRFVCDGDWARQYMGPDIRSFSVNNPFAETGLHSVPKLLRRTADLRDMLNDLATDDTALVIDDTVLERKQDPDEGPVPSITVYCSRPDHVEG